MAAESLARRIGKLKTTYYQLTLATIIICLAASFCVAQDPKVVAPEPAKPTDNALIYFYRIKQFAGSALEPIDAILRAAEMLHCSWRDVWRNYSQLPAKFIGVEHELKAGARADFCLIEFADLQS